MSGPKRKFTPEQEEAIRVEYGAGSGLTQKALAEKYGTSIPTICKIVTPGYREAHLARVDDWRRRHPDQVRAHNAKSYQRRVWGAFP